MIYRLRYCNKDGVEARVDIQKGSSTPVIEVEGTERPFILSYNNDKGNKSGMFLTSSADIEIYETPEFNIDNLKTSNETELSVTHYIDNVITWQGFIIPDFFSIEVRNNPVITMTASDRLGTLKNVTLDDLPTMVNIRELAVLCLNKTGLTLPLRTMADFNNGTGVNDFFNSKILTQRLSDTKGRSISCYDILSSILTASNSFLVQRAGAWHIINKIQHEAGSGKLYTGATSFINWSDVIFNFSDISIGGRRTIVPVAASTGVYHEHGGGLSYPDNFDFSNDLTGWTAVNGFVASINNKLVEEFEQIGSFQDVQRTVEPVYKETTTNKYLVNLNYGINYAGANKPYLRSPNIPIAYPNTNEVNITVDINATAPFINDLMGITTINAKVNLAIIASDGTNTLFLDGNGVFQTLTKDPYIHSMRFDGDKNMASVTSSKSIKGLLKVESGSLSDYNVTVRIYGHSGSVSGGGTGVVYRVASLINSVQVKISTLSDLPKGNIYKIEQGSNFTKEHEIDTSIWGDYLTGGLNGYFYNYPFDDTSSLYNSNNELTSKWTAYNDTEQLPLLQHITRQKSRMFSVAHDLLSAEIEVSDFDPLAIFVSCGKRYTVVSAQFDFFKSNLSVELEEVAFQNNVIREYIYSYFGDGESGIKSIGGISGGSGGGSTGGGLTPEQLEILSFWKKDPDRENTIFTEMNAYSKLELSAYGAGNGGGGGGSDYERLDTWASYDSSKAGWVLSAFLGNDLNTRVIDIDDRVTDLENTAGSGTVTSVGISVPTGLSVSNSPITSSGVIAIGLQTGYSIPTTAKQGQWDTAYSNTHTHSNKTVLDGITSALVSNWNTAFTNNHTHSNKTVLDGITSALVSNWNTAFTNNHTHSNKTQLDLITQSNIDVLSRLSIVNGNLQIDGNAYATGELSAYGAGDGGSGGGGIIETVYGYSNLGQTFNNSTLTDTFNAYTINQINTRLVAVESGSALTVNTTGTGNAITSISKAGTVITASKDLTFSLSGHTHTISDIANLQTTLNSKLETSIFNTHNNDNVRHITAQERTKWDTVVTDFDNLEIGGRNLWTNSRTIPATVTIGQYGYQSGFKNILELGLKTGELITFSVYVSNIPVGESVLARIDFYRPDYTYIEVRNTQYSISNEGVIYVSTFMRDTSEFDRIRYRVFPANYTADYQVDVVHEKLERGTKATDWSPAPEDQVSDWLTTDVNSFSFIKNKPTLLSQFTDNIGVATHIANTSNPHNVTKAQVGLGNVLNVASYSKTESDAALALKLNKSVFDDLFEKVEVSTGVYAIKAKYSFYSIGEVSAYGLGSGGSGGGSYDRLDAWADYDSTKSGWVLSALLGNELNTRVGNLNTRVGNLESGSALTVNTTGTGNAVTSISKSGTVITANKDLTFSLAGHTHTISDVTNLQTTLNNKLETSIFNTHNTDNIRHITGAERTKWDGVVTDFNNLEIGGRNLWTNSRTTPATVTVGQYGYSSGSKNISELGLKTGELITFSVYVSNIPVGESVLARIDFYRPDGTYIDVRNTQYSISNEGVIYVSTFMRDTSEFDRIRYRVFPANYTADYQVDVVHEKLERGNKATDWTPAPEDQVSDWNTTDVNSFSFIKNKPTLLSQFTDNIGVATHIANTSNPHSVTKAQVGLGNVDNTADSAKNVLSATKLTTARTIAGVSFDGTANIAIPFANLASKPTTLGGYGISDAVTLNTAQTISGEKTFSDTVTAPTFSGALSGNASSSTKLQTPRTIWGQSFDGTENVTGALSGATTITASISVATPKVIFNAAGWSMEQVGSELQMKHNNVLKMRFTSAGSIVATEEITAFG